MLSRKNRIKRSFFLMISIMLLAGSTVYVSAGQGDEGVSIAGFSDVTEWTLISDDIYAPLEVCLDRNYEKFAYGEGGLLCSIACSERVTEYEFEGYAGGNYRLKTQRSGRQSVSYIYDGDESASAVGFVYEGEIYEYVYQEYLISGIMKNGAEIVSYTYDEYCDVNKITDTSGENISDINALAGCSWIYDTNTGWYYSSGRFFTGQSGFINNYVELGYFGADGGSFYVMTPSTYAFLLDENVNADVAQIEKMADFGKAVAVHRANGAWISDLSTTGKYRDIEIIARAIYGEFSADKDLTKTMEGDFDAQREAVMWVIQNRVDRTAQFGVSSPFEVVTKVGEFYSLTGKTEAETQQARNPKGSGSTVPAGWKNAYLLACYLYEANNGYWNGFLPASVLNAAKGKPKGITTQTFFASNGTWEKGYNKIKKTFTDSLGTTRRVYNIAENVGPIEGVHGNNPRFNVFFCYK